MLTDSDLASLLPALALIFNILSALCFMGSILCALLALDSYRRVRRLMKRRAIGQRVRVAQ